MTFVSYVWAEDEALGRRVVVRPFSSLALERGLRTVTPFEK